MYWLRVPSNPGRSARRPQPTGWSRGGDRRSWSGSRTRRCRQPSRLMPPLKRKSAARRSIFTVARKKTLETLAWNSRPRKPSLPSPGITRLGPMVRCDCHGLGSCEYLPTSNSNRKPGIENIAAWRTRVAVSKSADYANWVCGRVAQRATVRICAAPSAAGAAPGRTAVRSR